ncbi:MAG TPA: SpoIIE family protein phosphatase [Spirochaetota bacterium]|nr:SpoIIE family protein phosphatase [Spirochaetota bacterium]HPV97821.1 SpoIIE family protein phosphatase [Spirochaetota bacterium]
MDEGPRARANVVVIDDDKLVNDLICRILKKEYSARGYESAEEAIRSEDLGAVDVIIADVNLPGMDGIQFLDRVQLVDSGIPVILITGYGDIDIAISALQSGATDFILKPFKNEQISISVERALEARRLVLENRALLEELRNKNQELETLNAEIYARNIEIEKELDIAANLQQCLFPAVLPEIDRFDLALKFRPVEKVSGDFFDFIIYGRELFSFVFADVSGHGVPAALYSAMVKTAISSVRASGPAPSDFMSEVNAFLIGSQKRMSYNYVTIFYGLFDLAKGALTYCNAGIPSPAIIHADGNSLFLDPNSPFVGIFENSVYRNESVRIAPGDRLVFYTDGVFEQTGKNDRIMGQGVFLELLKSLGGMKIHELIERLFERVMEFSGSQRPGDDLTLIGMSYREREV